MKKQVKSGTTATEAKTTETNGQYAGFGSLAAQYFMSKGISERTLKNIGYQAVPDEMNIQGNNSREYYPIMFTKNPKYQTVLLCEGLLNALTLIETGLYDSHLIFGVTDIDNLKGDYLNFFKDKKVIIISDDDNAAQGVVGIVRDALTNVAASILVPDINFNGCKSIHGLYVKRCLESYVGYEVFCSILDMELFDNPKSKSKDFETRKPISTGIDSINMLTNGGLHPNTIVVLYSPLMLAEKRLLTLQIATNISKRKFPVLYASYNDMDDYAQGFRDFEQLTDNFSIAEIEEKSVEMTKSWGIPPIIIINNLDLMVQDNPKKNKALSEHLRKIAENLNTSVIISSFNALIKELNTEADIILKIDNAHNFRYNDRKRLKISCLKNICDKLTTELIFIPETACFSEVDSV